MLGEGKDKGGKDGVERESTAINKSQRYSKVKGGDRKEERIDSL